ncbi:MAG: glycosyltransferase family 4 protein [Candidatus Caldatribacteriota bacterium]|nr:glycosyltransferase family 4 protein [Candidatus Caldatribacteriota bacterium]
MRILLVNHFPLEGSGSGIYTKNLAQELSRMGHKVKVIFPEHQHIVNKDFETRAIIFKGKNNKGYEINFNFPCFTSHPRSNNTFYNLNDRQIRKYIKIMVDTTQEEVDKFKPDIIHAQHLWITPYAALKTGLPYVVTAHGTDLKGFRKDRRYHAYALKGAQNAKKVITISRQVDRDTKELYKIKDDQRIIILNGYDEELFKPKNITREEVLKRFNISKIPKYIVFFAGKLAHFKGVDVLLKAAKIYGNQLNGSVMTLIAGNGVLYDELVELKNSLGLKNTFFLGHINQSQLVDLYNIADVSTVPSRSEPFGLVAIEALACGTPVVGTDQGGLPDFITKDVGILVKVEDDIDLAKAIINELMRCDKNERRKQAYKYALNNFSLKSNIREVEEVYEEAII